MPLTHPEPEPTSTLPAGQHTAYHVTLSDWYNDILDTGLDPNKVDNKYEHVNTFLEHVAHNENITNKPNNRAECVYLFSDYADIVDLPSDTAVFAIDLRELHEPFYAGSFHTVTKMYQSVPELQHGNVEQVLDLRFLNKTYQEAYDLAIEYWDTLEQVSPPVTRGGELLVEQHIPPRAICDSIITP